VTGTLADTHALLWWLSDDHQLSDAARALISSGEEPVHFSAASIWEVGIKVAAGKAVVPEDLIEALVSDLFVEIPITALHALEAAGLPLLHRDPFDRMIVAQARLENLMVITTDQKIADYGVPVLW
jgi:PIN domain nuclease of toxin-antitoxin system